MRICSGMPTTGLRFFTVYGPWGRPDMAMWLFADAIMAGRPIRLFNHGQMRRDFTYVDDVVEAVARLVPKPAVAEPGLVGERPRPGNQQRPLARLQHRQQQPGRGARRGAADRGGARPQGAPRDAADAAGDVPETCADVADLERAVGFRPKTPIAEGVRRFLEWLQEYHPA